MDKTFVAGKLRLLKPASLCLAAALGLAACQTTTGSTTMTSASPTTSVRPATEAEIAEVAVGNTVNGAMTYRVDGTYLYRGASPGRYNISEGRICVNFQSGGRRCDRIVTSDDGETLTMINRSGESFPFG